MPKYVTKAYFACVHAHAHVCCTNCADIRVSISEQFNEGNKSIGCLLINASISEHNTYSCNCCVLCWINTYRSRNSCYSSLGQRDEDLTDDTTIKGLITH